MERCAHLVHCWCYTQGYDLFMLLILCFGCINRYFGQRTTMREYSTGNMWCFLVHLFYFSDISCAMFFGFLMVWLFHTFVVLNNHRSLANVKMCNFLFYAYAYTNGKCSVLLPLTFHRIHDTKEEGEMYEKKFPQANVEQSYGKSF